MTATTLFANDTDWEIRQFLRHLFLNFDLDELNRNLLLAEQMPGTESGEDAKRAVNAAMYRLLHYPAWVHDDHTSFYYYALDKQQSNDLSKFYFDKTCLGFYADLLAKNERFAKAEVDESANLLVARLSWLGKLVPARTHVIPKIGNRIETFYATAFGVRDVYGKAGETKNNGGFSGLNYITMDYDQAVKARDEICERRAEANMPSAGPITTIVDSFEIVANIEDAVLVANATYTVRHNASDFAFSEERCKAMFMRPAFYRKHGDIRRQVRSVVGDK